MTRPTLHVVDPDPALPHEAVAQRVRRLQAEAKSAAADHVLVMQAQLRALAATAAEIAEGGSVYPVGVAELARKLVEEAESRVMTVEMILARVK